MAGDTVGRLNVLMTAQSDGIVEGFNKADVASARYAEGIKKLDFQVGVGLISQDAYNAKIAQAQAQFSKYESTIRNVDSLMAKLGKHSLDPMIAGMSQASAAAATLETKLQNVDSKWARLSSASTSSMIAGMSRSGIEAPAAQFKQVDELMQRLGTSSSSVMIQGMTRAGAAAQIAADRVRVLRPALFDNLAASMSRMAASFGLAFAAFKSIHFVIGSIKAFEETERSTKKLDAVLMATGNTTGFTTEQLVKYADQLELLTAIDDSVIKSAAAVLTTFQSIQGEGFTRTLSLAADLSAVMDTDLQSAVTSLGKALTEPKEGLTALRRAGIIFTDQQKDQIQTMLAANDVAGAQGIILDTVAGKVEGAAARMKTSWAGLGVDIGNFKEALGSLGSDETAGGLANALGAPLRGMTESLKVTNTELRLLKALLAPISEMRMPNADDVTKFGDVIRDQVFEWEMAGVDLANLPDLGRNAPAQEAVAKLTEAQSEAIDKLTAELEKQIATFGMSAEAIKLWELEQANIPDDAMEAVRALSVEAEALKENDKAWKEIEHTNLQNQEAIESLLESLEKEVATLGMDTDAILLWELAQRGAAEGAVEHAKALLEQKKAHENMMSEWEASEKEMDRLSDAAEKIFADTRTPAEKFAKEMESLNELLEKDWISVDTYDRAVKKLRESLEKPLKHDLASALEFGSAEAFTAMRPIESMMSEIDLMGGMQPKGPEQDVARSEERQEQTQGEMLKELLTHTVILKQLVNETSDQEPIRVVAIP